MKKALLSILLAILATVVWADETPKKPSCAGFVTSGFWENWELSIGAGAATAFSNGADLGAFRNRIGFESNISATKWMHPITGLRLQLQGGSFTNYDAQYGKMSWPYVFVHFDVMANLSNWIGGYREDRAYYAIPFVGFGYMASNITDVSQRNNYTGLRQGFAMTYGILNKFRLSPSFDFNIELKSMTTASRISPVAMGGSYLFEFSATAGFTYRFKHRGWKRGVAGYTAEDIRAFQRSVADGNAALESARAENDRLNSELQTAKTQAAEAAATLMAQKAAPVVEQAPDSFSTSLILYDFSMSKLSSKEKTRLELVADVIKSGPKDKIYRLEGHADYQTGSAESNKRLAENRAKSVYDFLIGKGVNPKQLTYEGKGGVQNPFENNQRANRAVVIQ